MIVDKVEKRVKKIFEGRKGKVGIQQIKMIYERKYEDKINHKKIIRIKGKNGFVTKIRRKNKYSTFAKAEHEHKVCSNHLKRAFAPEKPDLVYSIDITQINYGATKAYLAAVKDLCSKDIIGFNISKKVDVNLTNLAINKAIGRLTKDQLKKLMIHSDQGMHFTHHSYRNILESNGVTQSMSRRGNCLDNAPIETFFGIIKDQLDLKGCNDFRALKKMITKEIRYYNYERPQIGLNKKPPIEYRGLFKTVGAFY